MPLATFETRIGQAMVQYACENESAARKDLEEAFRLAIASRCQQFPIIRPADLERACSLCLALEIAPAVDHARHLLTRGSETRPRDLTEAPLPDPREHAIDAGEDRRTLHHARTRVLTIRTFGGLEILRNGTHPVADDGWQGSRPALLFKAILVHGCRHIPKDILIEALWPDQPPEKSLRNFKVTLHRLRKLFEPDMDSTLGSAYIHLKDNLVSLDAHLCRVDTDAFHRLCKKARRVEPGGDREDLLEMSRAAEMVYRGDFLPEEPYLTWAEMKRSTLREEFLQLMYRLGKLLFQQKEFSEARRCYRRILRIDPAQEKAQRRLMRLLSDAGRSGEAVRLYREFRAYLETEIGATPDEATTGLFRSINDQMGRNSGPAE